MRLGIHNFKISPGHPTRPSRYKQRPYLVNETDPDDDRQSDVCDSMTGINLGDGMDSKEGN